MSTVIAYRVHVIYKDIRSGDAKRRKITKFFDTEGKAETFLMKEKSKRTPWFRVKGKIARRKLLILDNEYFILTPAVLQV